MMKKLAITFVMATLLLVATTPVQAAYTPQYNVYAAGSSAMFNTFALAAGKDNAYGSNAALCGENHWTAKFNAPGSSGGGTNGTGAELLDPRSGSILPEGGNIWIVWDAAAASQTAGQGRVCVYVAVDSVVGNRAFFASNTIHILSAVGSSDGDGNSGTDLVPYLGQGATLPQAIHDIVEGATIDAGMTDIRPEDAKFATIRCLTGPAHQQIYRYLYPGLGYGSGAPPTTTIGTPIYSSRSTVQANPVDYTIYGPDPIVPGNSPREYTVQNIGAAPVIVLYNATNTAAGHLGDGNYTDVNRAVLAQLYMGIATRIRDLDFTGRDASYNNPIHVMQREPLSGTFNTFEFNVTLAREWYASYNTTSLPMGQETGVDPTLHTNCTVGPCTSENGNPFYHIAASGGTRQRAEGTGEMISAVNSVADSIGYAFWGFANFASSKAGNAKYMTVAGVDPLFATPSARSDGGTLYTFPQCGASLPCTGAGVTFANIANGAYPIWSMLRAVYNPVDVSNGDIIPTLISYAQGAAASNMPDFIPASSMTVFRSHFNQIVQTSTSFDFSPNNGFMVVGGSTVAESGGDMGGAILTIQSELDYINDTNPGGNPCASGCQQTNLWQ